eukprot:gene11452-15343_t
MMRNGDCPLTNVIPSTQLDQLETPSKCPFHAHHKPDEYHLNHQTIPLIVRDREFKTTKLSANLLADIGGGDRIRELCTRFYARAFLDSKLKEFFFEDDGAVAHGKRLADWIIQKMGGEGTPWSDSGRWGMRQPSHYKAWNNSKRDPSVRGDHFKLDDARVWMRLNFWAARECGLHEHDAFWKWYIEFIEHFIAVYERTAPIFAADDAEWSADPNNTIRYEKQEYHMWDVLIMR